MSNRTKDLLRAVHAPSVGAALIMTTLLAACGGGGGGGGGDGGGSAGTTTSASTNAVPASAGASWPAMLGYMRGLERDETSDALDTSAVADKPPRSDTTEADPVS